MKDGDKRYCDVCNDVIPRGEKYNKTKMRREIIQFFKSANDPDLIPSWTENPDGTITLDMCLTCYLAIANIETKQFT